MGVARIAPLIAFAALAVLPESAGAETIRVAKGGSDAPDCGRGANLPCEHIAAALGLTPGAQDGDVISIGPGDFVEGGPISTNKNVRLVGAGAGTLAGFDPATDTRVRLGSDGADTLKLTGNGGSVEHLRVDAFDGSGLTNVALRISPPADMTPKTFAVDDVTAATPGSDQVGLAVNPGGAGPTRADVRISNSRIAGASEDSDSLAVGIKGAAPAFSVTITDSLVSCPFGAITANTTALTVLRSTIETAELAIDGDADLTIERSTLRGARAALRPRGIPAGIQSVRVRSSLLVTDASASSPSRVEAPIAIDNTSGTVDLGVVGSTLIGRGQVDGGLVLDTAAGAGAVVDLRGTAVAVPGTDLRTLGAGTESISASYSAYGDASGNVPAPGSGTNVGGDPLIGADFRPLASSPLIDKGDPALFAAGELDLAGVPRGPAPEIGAFEYAPPPAGGTNFAPPPPPAGGTNVAPGLSGFTVSNETFAPTGIRARRGGRKVQRGTSFRYTLSEAARVVITVERKLGGYRSGKRCRSKRPAKGKRRRCTLYRKVGALSESKPAGRQSTPFGGRFRGKALKPGSYRASIVATDAGGLTSARRSAGFKLVWP